MTFQDHQSVGDDVRKLLTKTYDLKLMHGGTADAIGFARDAYEKASTLPEAWSHWRQLAAYRLAHLLLRQDDSLQEIDELLSIAEGADFLEPLRSFCHLAVLHRIRSDHRKTVDRNAVTARIETVFDIATGFVQQAASPGESAVVRYIAQEPSFNSLEVLSYALGLPYRLAGIARKDDFSPYSNHPKSSRDHAWQILSRDNVSVWMTEEFARREFTSRIVGSHCVAVELAPNGQSDEKSKWAFQPSEQSLWTDVPQHSDRLITTLLENSARSMAELRRKVGVTNYEDPIKRLRDVKSHTKRGIQDLTGDKQLKVFENRKDSEMYGLSEGTNEVSFLVLRKYQPPKPPRKN